MTPPTTAIASSMPITPPISTSSTDSANTCINTLRLENPIVFNTASSGIRSRTACAMVLPINRIRVKNTAPMIAVTIKPTLANWLTNEALKAFSVSVLVSWSELTLIASIACAMRSACAGSAILVMYQPTVPLPKALASSKYFQLNNSRFSAAGCPGSR